MGDAFDAQILSMQPPVFGDATNRRYLMHAIIGLAEKPNPTEAWAPTDPIVDGSCNYGGAVGPGQAVQRVSVLSGGLRFPMCQFQAFNVVFEQIAQGITTGLALACEVPFPEPPDGVTIDPATVQVEYTAEGGSPVTFTQVTSPEACQAGSFYVVDEVVHLCPETCDTVKGGGGSMDLLYGCAAPVR
jgi:hypothetical protein